VPAWGGGVAVGGVAAAGDRREGLASPLVNETSRSSSAEKATAEEGQGDEDPELEADEEREQEDEDEEEEEEEEEVVVGKKRKALADKYDPKKARRRGIRQYYNQGTVVVVEVVVVVVVVVVKAVKAIFKCIIHT
jgi:hypothetical protein